jgi:hypothetical protein
VEFDSGRINFTAGLEKKSFAFVNVDGSAERESGGRWRLDLRAEPMRAGVTLQQAGVIWVQGRIAGTSARLQPAEIALHWTEASLADVLRLAQKRDFGVRGQFGLDLAAKSVLDAAAGAPRWEFALRARVSRVHRWDLPERPDHPAVNLSADATWDAANGRLNLTSIAIQAPGSHIRGTVMETPAASGPRIDWESPGVSLEDLLAWYRAFHPGMAEGLRVAGFLSGSVTTAGWMPRVEDGEWRFSGGTLAVPGIAQPVRMSAAEGSAEKNSVEMGPVALMFAQPPQPAARPAAGRRGTAAAPAPARTNAADSLAFGAVYDFLPQLGTISAKGRTARVEDWMALAAAFGRPVNRRWELAGNAALDLQWQTQWSAGTAKLRGSIEFDGARFQVAGLNFPVALGKTRMEWNDTQKKIRADSLEALGAKWSGTLSRESPAGGTEGPAWAFALHADHLNASDLDRWMGPRARPNWLERLLPGLLGSTPVASVESSAAASALLRDIRAEGQLAVDEFSLAGIKLKKLRATMSLGAARLSAEKGEAEVAGSGSVRGNLEALFVPRPRYVAILGFERVNLESLAADTALKNLVGGMASGELNLKAQGIGRDELLSSLEGHGKAKLRNAEFRAPNLEAALEGGAKQASRSKWPSGEGEFAIGGQEVRLESLRLDDGGGRIRVWGTVNFKRVADLQVQALGPKGAKPGNGGLLRLSGTLEALKVAVQPGQVRTPGRR